MIVKKCVITKCHIFDKNLLKGEFIMITKVWFNWKIAFSLCLQAHNLEDIFITFDVANYYLCFEWTFCDARVLITLTMLYVTSIWSWGETWFIINCISNLSIYTFLDGIKNWVSTPQEIFTFWGFTNKKLLYFILYDDILLSPINKF